MKAIVYRKFGSPEVLNVQSVIEPAPAAKQVLVSVCASSTNGIDSRSRQGHGWPLVSKRFPKTPGVDVAGIVTEVGAKVKTLKAGDRVFGATNPFHGGALAEIVTVPAKQLAVMPAMMGFEEAAALPIAALAAILSIEELGKVHAGTEVLIYGSSGAVGLFAIQIAKQLGARVTAVAGSEGVKASLEMGADEAIDYKAGATQFSRQFDVIVDLSNHFPFARARKHLKSSGLFVDSSPTIPKFIVSGVANLFRTQKHLMLATNATTAGLNRISTLHQSGQLRISISHRFPFSAAREAFARQERGGVIGKVILVNDFTA